jgi:hypothetical protein
MNAGAMNVQETGNLWRGVTVGAEQKGLKAQGNARSLVGLGFLAQGQKFAAGAGVGLGKDRFHGNVCRITYARMLRQTRPAGKWKRSGRAPSNSIKKRLTAQIPAQNNAFLKLM